MIGKDRKEKEGKRVAACVRCEGGEWLRERQCLLQWKESEGVVSEVKDPGSCREGRREGGKEPQAEEGGKCVHRQRKEVKHQ